MQNQFDPQIETILLSLTRNIGPDEDLYAVGGMVRSIYMQRPVIDIDIVVAGDVYRLGKQVADEQDFPYFVLNDQYHTVRIIIPRSDGKMIHMDIVKMRGNDIVEDLKLRDFTINAMALDLRNQRTLIDPFQALLDIKNKKLVQCSPTVFEDDPIRILRAIRQAVEFDFQISPLTVANLKKSIHGLDSSSPERRRDEVMRMLTLTDVSRAMHILHHMNILPVLFHEYKQLTHLPSSLEWNSTGWNPLFSTLKELTAIESLLLHPSTGGATNIRDSQIIIMLGRFRSALREYFQFQLNVDRLLRSMFYFIFFFLGFPSIAQFESRAKAFALSNKEIRLGVQALNSKNRIHEFAGQLKPVSGSQIYLFLKESGPGAILICLYSLAQAASWQEATDPYFLKVLDTVALIWSSYFENSANLINPPQWLSGHEVGDLLRAEDKVKTGYWIEQLKMASADGKIANKEEAIQFIRTRYQSG